MAVSSRILNRVYIPLRRVTALTDARESTSTLLPRASMRQEYIVSSRDEIALRYDICRRADVEHLSPGPLEARRTGLLLSSIKRRTVLKRPTAAQRQSNGGLDKSAFTISYHPLVRSSQLTNRSSRKTA